MKLIFSSHDCTPPQIWFLSAWLHVRTKYAFLFPPQAGSQDMYAFLHQDNNNKLRIFLHELFFSYEQMFFLLLQSYRQTHMLDKQFL